jgi:putative transposase
MRGTNYKHLAARQIAKVLEKIDALQATGKTLAEACQVTGISQQSYRRWRARGVSTKRDHVQKLKELQAENAQLKRMLDDVSLRETLLREVLKGNY